MIIRELKFEDLPFLVEVRNECREWLHDPSKFTLAECEQWFLDTSPKFFILEINDECIGYFRTSKWTKDSVYIGLDIHKNHRGNGYAVPAYKMFINMLDKKIYYLSVLTKNKRAIHIYKKLGFETIGWAENSLDMRLCR